MSKPAVWLFGDTPIGAVYGASYMLESWSRGLTDLGWETRTITPSGALRERTRTPERLEFPTLGGVGRPDDEHSCYFGVAELLRARRRRPDVVLVTTPLRVGVLGLAIAQYLKVPLVLAVSTDTTGMAQHYSSLRMFLASWPKLGLLAAGNPAIRKAIHTSLRRPATTMAERSTHVAAEVVAAMGAHAAEVILLGERSRPLSSSEGRGARVSVIPSGIDRLPRPTEPSPIRWRPGALRVLYAGRFSREKTLGLLIDAAAQARAAGLDVDLHLIGGGHVRAELEARIARQGLQGRATLHDGVPRDQLRAVYASADVFAFPSIVDTQAFVLNEAAHEGLPLLVADDVNPVVEHGVSALVVGHTPQAFAAAFGQLVDVGLRRRLGAGARCRAEDCTEAAQTRKVSDVLRRACGGVEGTTIPPVRVWPLAEVAASRPGSAAPARPFVAPALVGDAPDDPCAR